MIPEWDLYVSHVFHGTPLNAAFHPWKNLAWYALYGGPYYLWTNAGMAFIDCLVLAWVLRGTNWPLKALAVLPWLPSIFVSWHVCNRPEVFELFILAVAFAYIVEETSDWGMINLAFLCGAGLFVHPEGAFVFPAVWAGLLSWKRRLRWTIISLPVIGLILYKVDIPALLKWGPTYDGSPTTPAILMGFPQNIGRFLRFIFHVGVGHTFPWHIGMLMFLFAMICVAAFRENVVLPYVKRMALFCFTFLVSFGLLSGCEYWQLTDVFLILGGLWATDAVLDYGNDFKQMTRDAIGFFVVLDAVFLVAVTLHGLLVLRGLIRPFWEGWPFRT